MEPEGRVYRSPSLRYRHTFLSCRVSLCLTTVVTFRISLMGGGGEGTGSGHAVLQGNISGRGHLEGRGNSRMLLKIILC